MRGQKASFHMRSFIAALLLFPSMAYAVDVTYSAGTTAFSPPATPTDMCYIQGSSAKAIRVRKMEFTSTQTTAGVNSFFLIKRSSANSGGTCTKTNPVGYNKNSNTAGADVYTCTGNPTLGNLQGALRAEQLLTPAPASLADGLYTFDFSVGGDDLAPIVLNDNTESLSLNFAGAALPTGLSIQCNFVWTE